MATSELPAAIPQPRSVISALAPYSRAVVVAGTPRFLASSNEAPSAPPPEIVDPAVAAVRNANRYPGLHAYDLVTAIARHHSVSTSGIAVGDGSLSLLTYVLLAFTRHGDRVVYPWRSYEGYPIAVAAAGGVGVAVANGATGEHDLEAIIDAIDPQTSAVILCSPNNPTGVALTHTQLAGFMGRVRPETLVILDLAYTDFERGEDTARAGELLAEHPNLVCLRTFSKAFGLAGLRVGYLIADARIVEPIARIQPPFPVSAPAIAAAVNAIGAREYRARTVDQVVVQRVEVARMLSERGIATSRSSANFVWLPLGADSTRFAQVCADAGLRVRCFADEGVRITLGEPGLPSALGDVLDRYMRDGCIPTRRGRRLGSSSR